MSDDFLGRTVRDRRSGVVGRAIARVDWEDAPPSLIVQPPVRKDHTVPPTVYVAQAAAEVVPEPADNPWTQ